MSSEGELSRGCGPFDDGLHSSGEQAEERIVLEGKVLELVLVGVAGLFVADERSAIGGISLFDRFPHVIGYLIGDYLVNVMQCIESAFSPYCLRGLLSSSAAQY